MIKQPKEVDSFHIVISGFLQYEGKPNGMIRLWRELHEAHANPNTLVLLRTWNDNMKNLAEFIWRLGSEYPSVKIYGYSWGGAASVKLAKCLNRRGMVVSHMVLSDAVYRHTYWLGNWRALVPWSEIKIPSNVKVVDWFRQKDKWPKLSGHKVVAKEPTQTIVNEGKMGNCSHTYMDELYAFHKKALSVSNAPSFRSGVQ